MVFQKGLTPWNKGKKGLYSNVSCKGKPLSIEHRKKLSLSHSGQLPPITGKKHSEEAKEKMRLAKVGHVPWNKGKSGIYSEGTRLKISQSGKGRPPWNKGIKGSYKTSEETREKLSRVALASEKIGRGETHYLYISGSSKLRRQRNGLQESRWRRFVFERDLFTCQKCGKVGGDLQAHHIKSYARYPEVRFNTDNGMTLCKRCHHKIHRKTPINHQYKRESICQKKNQSIRNQNLPLIFQSQDSL